VGGGISTLRLVDFWIGYRVLKKNWKKLLEHFIKCPGICLAFPLIFLVGIKLHNHDLFSWNQIAQSWSPTVTKYNPKTQTYLNLQP